MVNAMNKLTILASAAVLALSVAAPAQATRWGSSSWGSTSGGHSSTSSGTTTSGGHSSTSSGSTSVPEPGQLGLFAAGAVLIAARRFRRKR
jgi:hypothetical protein